MNIQLHLVRWPIPPAFHSLAYANHAADFSLPAAPPGMFAVGAVHERRAAALALVRAAGGAGEVLSLFVARQWQSHGLGTRLLQEAERLLRRAGAERATLAYPAPTEFSPALERVLQKRGWSLTEARIILAQVEGLSGTPVGWLLQTALPPDYFVFPWIELTAAERASLEAARSEIDPSLWPFSDESLVDPVCSLGLRHYGEVVGWLIAHRVSPEFVRFTSLYVRERWRAPKLTFGLLAEASRRKRAHYGSSVTVSLAVRLENTPMVQLCERHLRPMARSWSVLHTAHKVLREG